MGPVLVKEDFEVVSSPVSDDTDETLEEVLPTSRERGYTDRIMASRTDPFKVSQITRPPVGARSSRKAGSTHLERSCG